MNKVLQILKDPKRIVITIQRRCPFKIFPDKPYLKIFYKTHIGKKLNLDNPQSFNEKLQWLKLNDQNPNYIKMADKYEAKKYVASIIGSEYIIPTLGIYNKFKDINFDVLPNKFVVKCTHDSGGIVICKDKNKLDIKSVKKRIKKSLRRNYYLYGREWSYKNIKPRILIEKYMEDKNSHDDLIDYKFMCFNGETKMIFTCSDRNNDKGLKVTFFDLNWQKMPFGRHYPVSTEDIKKPDNMELMIELANKLAKDIPFLRVDFYEINGKVYFGELTFFPGNGMEEFNPDEWDYKVGEMLDISKVGK